MTELEEIPTKATWWNTLVGDGAAIWNKMGDKKGPGKQQHVGYRRVQDSDYEGDDKFAVFRADGLRGHCDDCEMHLLDPDEFLGHAATEYEAALMVQEYCEDVADEVEWTGKPPILRESSKHPRAKVFMA